MSAPQQKIREVIFQMLYSYDMGKADTEDMLELMMKEIPMSRTDVKNAQKKLETLIAVLEEIDSMIAGASFSYDFDRIQKVEKNILRLGVYEIFFDDTIPDKVAISEAVRLAKKFSTKEAANFVNAILDTLYKAKNGKEVDVELLNQSIEELKLSEDQAKNKALEEKNEES